MSLGQPYTPNAAQSAGFQYKGTTVIDPKIYATDNGFIFSAGLHAVKWMNELEGLWGANPIGQPGYKQTFACLSGLAVGQAVYPSAANTVALATNLTTKPIGIVANKPTPTTCDIGHFYYVNGQSGLTVDAPVYLDNSGNYSGTAGTNSVVVGTAISTTEFLFFATPWTAQFSALAGPQGPAGGPQGTAGFQGNMGVQGIAAAIGYQGVNGTQGPQGVGLQGTTGNAGMSGFQGYMGVQGLDGPQGITGTGVQGKTGFQGTAGPQGVKGFQGNSGVQGIAGPVGPQGTKGPQGITGAGTQGAFGPQGYQGPSGGLTGTSAEIRHTLDAAKASNAGVYSITEWIPETAALAQSWTGVCWSPELGIFVAVSSDGTNQIMTSPNGVDWTSQNSSFTDTWEAICWANKFGLFIAVDVGTAHVITSPDAITWTSRIAGANTWTSVCHAPEIPLAVSVGKSGTNRTMNSTNGTTWNGHAAADDTLSWESVCWSPELAIFCAVASDGTNQVMTSTDGAAWTSHTPATVAAWKSITWAAELNLFCAVSFDGLVMTSPDGAVWTAQTASAAKQWKSIVWAPEFNQFVAVSFDGFMMTSEDAVNWVNRSIPEANQWNSICWAPEISLFCAVASSGTDRVMISRRFIGSGAAGLQGPVGVQGLAGANGFQGFTGIPSGIVGTYTITSGVPGGDSSPALPGQIFIDDITAYNTPSDIWLNKTDANGVDFSDYFGAIATRAALGLTPPAILKISKTDGTVFWISDVDTGNQLSPWNCLEFVPFYNIDAHLGSLTTGDSVDVEILIPGQTGIHGTQGFTGPQGITGAGVQGTAGVQGITGTAGATGPQGNSGVQGNDGVRGPQGNDGTVGPQGLTGATGTAGATGAQGFTGATGAVGPQGVAGMQGNSGVQGTAGVQGVAGVQGNDGTQGITGSTGAVGPQGLTGPQGFTGATGNAGPQGFSGVQGIAGAGTQGFTGVQGNTGVQGLTGPQGVNGTTTSGLFGENCTQTATDSNAGGFQSQASGFQSFAIGCQSYARLDRQSAYAMGCFAVNGDAQTSTAVLRNTTTNSTNTSLFMDGSSTKLTIPANTSWSVEVSIIARQTGGTSAQAQWILNGLLTRASTAASTTLVKGNNSLCNNGLSTTWNAQLATDTTAGSLDIVVAGETSKTIRWVATVRLTEVAE